jgi:hypothetical protein
MVHVHAAHKHPSGSTLTAGAWLTSAPLLVCASSSSSSSVQAAEKIAERAASSPRWRRAFVKLGGVEALLKLLRGGLDADTVRAIMRALAEMLKENTAQEVGAFMHVRLACLASEGALHCGLPSPQPFKLLLLRQPWDGRSVACLHCA